MSFECYPEFESQKLQCDSRANAIQMFEKVDWTMVLTRKEKLEIATRAMEMM